MTKTKEQKNKELREKRQKAFEDGFCMTCMKEKHRTGYTTCQKCGDRMRGYQERAAACVKAKKDERSEYNGVIN